MIYASIFADGHCKNSIFEENDQTHKFNPTQTPRLLRQAFLNQGIELNTADVNTGRVVAFDLHLEGREISEKAKHQYLIALENPNINKLNADSFYYENFHKVFSWDSRLFGLPNVIPILIPYPFEISGNPSFHERSIFSCLINANKAFKTVLPSDLYLERLNTIRWYERNAPEHFSLYGLGWSKSTPAYTLSGKIRRSVSRLQTKFFGIMPFPSYRGEIKNKSDVLRNSKFSFCYENSRDLSNYITEKIFDSLTNGCIPIYWGADNIQDHIPEDCYIDRRKFRNTEDVHRYLLTIGSKDHEKYQTRIAEFLESDKAKEFSSIHFASIIANHIARDIRTSSQ
jgi:hypothetical protein